MIMTKELPPYVMATGILKQVFEKIKQASTPPRFTQDYLVDKLGFTKSGSSLAMIPYLKKLGFLGSDGVPTNLYKKFRNPDTTEAGTAIAKGMKIAYADLYARSEYFHELDKGKLKSFLIEATGAEKDSRSISALVNTIEVLKSLATFDFSEDLGSDDSGEDDGPGDGDGGSGEGRSQRDFNISYTINLNLPETSDITVFDAIFKSLKEHIISNEKK